MIDPPQHRVIPLQRIWLLQYKVVLVGEVQEAAGDAAHLADVEGGETFGDGTAEVGVGVDDEHGGVPVLVGVSGRRGCDGMGGDARGGLAREGWGRTYVSV